jgi:hypothetical protein
MLTSQRCSAVKVKTSARCLAMKWKKFTDRAPVHDGLR